MKLAIATCEAFPQLSSEDVGLLALFAARGIEATPHVWNRWPASGVDAVLVRSTWDYHRLPQQFSHWLDGLERAGVPVFNDVETLRWNMDKHYLATLAARGVPIIPTAWVEQNAALDVAAFARQQGAHTVVIKPVVAANARATQKFAADDGAARAWLLDITREGAAMVQPYLESVAHDGEWSVIFLDGVFSHAVCKRPKPGDFRVQVDYGGTFNALTPPTPVMEAAQRVMEALPRQPVYGRVDLLTDGKAWLLGELELLEPSLSFSVVPDAMHLLVDAVMKRLKR